MEFFCGTGFKRPVRLCEETRKFAHESLHGKYGEEAYDTECYSRLEIERICRAAFEAAMVRNKRVISIDKANVLETSRLWRETVHRIAAEYPEVELSDMLVDNAAMQLVPPPAKVILEVEANSKTMSGRPPCSHREMMSGKGT